MQPGLTSANCLTRKPTINLVLEVRDSSFLLAGVASCKAHGSQLHRWVGGAQVVHVRMRTSHCSNLVVSSLCCSWCVMGSSFKCAGMVGVVQYLASRDIVRLLPSRAGGEGTELGGVWSVNLIEPRQKGEKVSGTVSDRCQPGGVCAPHAHTCGTPSPRASRHGHAPRDYSWR